MSDRSSAGWEASTSASSEPDTGSSSSARRTPTEDESSSGAGPTSRATRTFEKSHRATDTDDSEKWTETEVAPTLNGFDQGDKRATVLAFTQNQRDELRDLGDKAGMLDAQPGTHQQTYLLTSSAEASPAKTSPSPADEQDSQESGAASSSSSHGSLTLFSPMEDGCSLRTYPDFFPPTVDEISPSYSRRWPSSGFTTSPGECWTADTSECPSEGAVSSSLPDVLEADVHPRFYLSQKAAAGILRRAERRRKALPKVLAQALQSLASGARELVDPQETRDRTFSQLAPTLSTKNEVASSSTQRDRWYEQAAEMWGTVRRLTPSECEAQQKEKDP